MKAAPPSQPTTIATAMKRDSSCSFRFDDEDFVRINDDIRNSWISTKDSEYGIPVNILFLNSHEEPTVKVNGIDYCATNDDGYTSDDDTSYDDDKTSNSDDDKKEMAERLESILSSETGLTVLTSSSGFPTTSLPLEAAAADDYDGSTITTSTSTLDDFQDMSDRIFEDLDMFLLELQTVESLKVGNNATKRQSDHIQDAIDRQNNHRKRNFVSKIFDGITGTFDRLHTTKRFKPSKEEELQILFLQDYCEKERR